MMLGGGRGLLCFGIPDVDGMYAEPCGSRGQGDAGVLADE